MTPLRKRMLEDMRIRNYAKSTMESYIREVARFAKYYGKSPEALGATEVRAYLVHLVDTERVQQSRFTQTVAALRFLYTNTLDREWLVKHIPYPKRKKKLPVVLNADEIKGILVATKNPRDRTIVSVLYGTGMRVSELADLKVSDLDSKRMLIKIRNGKGKKERQVMLSKPLLALLRSYWKEYQPAEHMFLSRLGQPLGAHSIQTMCRKAGERAGVKVSVTPHLFRHAFASTLLEIGVDLRTLQILLGHSSISTTTIYLHVSLRQIRNTPSPFDLIAHSA